VKPPTAKGSVVRSTLEFLRVEAPAGTLQETLALLDGDVRAACERAGPKEEVPYPIVRALWESADRVIGGRDATWMERAGAFSIQSAGVQMYSGILRKSNPSEFLTQSVSLFQLYYHPGNMEVVYESPGQAILRLIDFDPATRLFCSRQTGGLRCALTLAEGQNPRARHVRCSLEGDAFCEWELNWQAGG